MGTTFDGAGSRYRNWKLTLIAGLTGLLSACITVRVTEFETSDQAKLLGEFSRLYSGDALFSKDAVGTIMHVEFSARELPISATDSNRRFTIEHSDNPLIAAGIYLAGKRPADGFAALIFTLDHSRPCLSPELVAATLPGTVTQAGPPSLVLPDTVTHIYVSDDPRTLHAIITTKGGCVYGGQLGRGTLHLTNDRRPDGPADSSPDNR